LLKERGHETFLFTYRAARYEAGDPHTTVFSPGGSRMVGGRIPRHELPNASIFRAFRRWLRGINPDVLHIHTNYSFPTSILLACRGVTPAVQTVHDFRTVCPTERGVTPDGRLCGGGLGTACYKERCVTRKRYLLELMTRNLHRPLILRSIYRMIAPSRALYDALARERLPVVHIPHFSDPAYAGKRARKSEDNLVLFVGYLHFSKGIGLLLLSFRKILEAVPSARLVIAGDGPMMEELRRYHKTLELGNAVTFLGAIPEDEVVQWYGRSSFVVLPSIIYENSPLTIYEAMACGRAVVGTRIGGIPELVIDGETGLLFERNNDSDLAAKIIHLLKNKPLAEKMGVAARRRAETEFTADRHIGSVLRLYESARKAKK